MTDIAIKIEGLGKKYRIGSRRSGDFRESFGLFWKKQKKKFFREFRNSGNLIDSSTHQFINSSSHHSSEFWALRDINFEIKQGEAVGIIGRNGAGKSTLLKILSRITKPSTGRFEINGRVSSLLEVGTGFHKELTGRENIYLNGTILGMKRREIKQKFDEIIDFSGVEQFIDTPVKHYSSGMLVRLAFSVAAHLEPEILIIDEVLAVGDAEFQKKCLGKMEDVTGQGRTVLFVSHNMGAVRNLCGRGIVLENGILIFDNKISRAVEFYQEKIQIYAKESFKKKVDNAINKGFNIIDFKILNEYNEVETNFFCGQNIIFKLDFENKQTLKKNDLAIGIILKNSEDQFISVFNNKIRGNQLLIEGSTGSIYCIVPRIPLMYGGFTISLLVQFNGVIVQRIDNAGYFSVSEGDYFSSGYPNSLNRQGVYLNHYWKVENY